MEGFYGNFSAMGHVAHEYMAIFVKTGGHHVGAF